MENLTKQEESKFWKQEKQKLEVWLCGYLKFLREVVKAQSPKTRRQKLNTFLELAKFQCLDLVEEEQDYPHLPIFKLVRNYLRAAYQEADEWIKDKRYVADQSKKWPDPPEGETALSYIQREVVERQRLECRFRDNRGRIRTSIIIAREHQQYLQWYVLAFMPARRQEEFRNLKVALCCPIQRPDFVKADGLYHPLPPLEVREKEWDGTLKDNYLHFCYFHEQRHYPQGVWVLDIQKYKTRKTHGPQSIVIPNRQFADGSCLYDYLQRYLYGWWVEVGYNNQFSDWWQPELKGRRGKWITKGRADFDPHDACYLPTRKKSVQWSWGYLFLQPFIGTPYGDVAFANAFERSAHRLIGKRTTPHTMRHIWATWAFQVGLNDAQLRSLAYAMGHSVETLRASYEHSTPQQKRRFIEETIDQLLFPNLPSQESIKESVPHDEPKSDLDSLIQSLDKLTPDERQRLIQALQNPS
ncbi:site-specific integrase [Phormidium sp. LEGE 05292]|uniref:site-specific integrase n=1 Tax=[Phormidium] sp. LEGE 05292 TaxID=767427 RepID=UPI001882CD8C|nr:site-specific integrase [Phormidium sp. LEGE 05292]MBE9229239.1 site-specific integrase [Phormidium sp. LEGE 05292]